MNQKRLLSLDFTRGIGIILVVWAHADFLVMDQAFYMKHLEFIHQIIYSFHMPLFFIISAALLKRSIEINQLNFIGLLKKLASNILVPFYSLGMLFFIIRIITPQSLIQKYSAVTMMKALLINQFDVEQLPNGVLWFLFSIFIFALLIYLLIELVKINSIIVLLAAAFLKLFDNYLGGITLFGFGSISIYFIFFVVGYLTWKWILEPKIINPILFYPILFFVFLVSFNYLYIYNFSLFHLICGISASFLLIGISINIRHSPDRKILKMLYSCGGNSMLIFVLHVPFFVFIKKIMQYNNLGESYLGFGIAVMGGTALPLFFGKIMSRYKKIYKFLFGRQFVTI